MSDYMTLEQMRGMIARHVQMSSDSGSRSRTRIDEWINGVYMDIVHEFLWPSLVDGSEAVLTVTSGEKYVYLPKYIDQVIMVQASAYDVNLLHQGLREITRRFGGGVATSSGGLVMYADAGEVGRKTDFSSTAEQINCSLESGTDTVDVRLVGLNDDGDHVEETVTISAGVADDSSASFTDLISASTDGNQSVPVIIKGTTSTTEYATISANERTVRYKRLRVWSVPDTAESLIIYYKRKVTDLTDDDQTPEIPVSQVIVHRVIAMQYSHDRKWASAAQYHEAKAAELLAKLMRKYEEQDDEVKQGIPMITRRHRGGGTGFIYVKNS